MKAPLDPETRLPGLTEKEERELRRLHKKWACRRANRREISRAMELDRKAEYSVLALAMAKSKY